MVEAIDQVQAELDSLGYRTSVVDTPQGRVVSFDYTLETGSLKGTTVKVGLSFQENQYPEYPPHWIHITPPIDDGKGGSTQSYSDAQGNTWLAMSRPPGDMWDRLPTKHMDTFIKEHLRRIWKDV